MGKTVLLCSTPSSEGEGGLFLLNPGDVESSVSKFSLYRGVGGFPGEGIQRIPLIFYSVLGDTHEILTVSKF